MKRKKTSWGHVASWYQEVTEEPGSYARELILPNLLRLMAIEPNDVVLDLGCGPGFYARAFREAGATVIGVDIAPEAIEIARTKSPPDVKYFVASADAIPFVQDCSCDKIALILVLQNMDDIRGVLRECRRVIKPDGSLHAVLNHPAFRIPKHSSWGWDERLKVLYRRIDRYLSESTAKIAVHPGADPTQVTLSFHRPLQHYFKALWKAGFCVRRLEEWNSTRTSEPGPRKEAEDRARKEIPLFLYLEALPLLPPQQG